MKTQTALLILAILFVIGTLATQAALIEKIPPTYRPPIILTVKGTIAPYRTLIRITPTDTSVMKDTPRPYQTPIRITITPGA